MKKRQICTVKNDYLHCKNEYLHCKSITYILLMYSEGEQPSYLLKALYML